MEFKINDKIWRIEEKTSKELLDMYYAENGKDNEVTYIFGMTNKAKHIIYICNELCWDQILDTLKHELAHCFIWNNALYSVPNFNEEMACDLVACSHDFISEVVKKYIDLKK